MSFKRKYAPGVALGIIGVITTLGMPAVHAREAPRILEMTFEAYAFGLHAMTFDAHARFDPKSYELKFNARSEGVVSWLWDYSLTTRTVGRPNHALMKPVRFTANAVEGDNDKVVKTEIDFHGDGTITLRRKPPLKNEKGVMQKEDQIPPSELVNVTDPLSAMFTLMNGFQGDGQCNASMRIFDGKRRFDMLSKTGTTEKIFPREHVMYSGPTKTCRIEVRTIGGFEEDDEGKKRKPENMVIHMAKVRSNLPALPVRIQAKSYFGAVYADLVQVKEVEANDQAARK